MNHWLRGLARALTLAAAAALVSVPAAEATTGYFQPGYGARTKALAGAGVGGAGDSLTIALNPAGLTLVESGYDLGISLFTPRRGFEASGGTPNAVLANGRVRSGEKYFPIPYAGLAHRIDDKSVAGIAIYGNGGMNTSFPAFDRQCPNPQTGQLVPGSGIFCGGKAGVDLTQVFISPAYARQVTERLAIGIAPILSVQWFEAEGIQAFAPFSSDPANLSDTGTDYAFGAGVRVGAQYALTDRVRLGASYVTPIYMDKFEKFSGLFAEQGDFNVPPALTVGVAAEIDDTKTLFADYQRIWYGSIDSVGNPFASPGRLGDDGGPGFGWRDIGVYRLGVLWQAGPDWSLRAGYSYNGQPVPKSEVLFNVLAPGVVQHHITAGFSRSFGEKTDLLFTFIYVPEDAVTGRNPLDPGQTIRLEMRQFEATIGISKRF